MPLDIFPEPVALLDTLLPLSRIGVGQTVIVREVRTGVSEHEGGDIGLRLLELGFVEGESLRVIAHGFPGNEPIAVRIGNTTFALRRFEAEHVLVTVLQSAKTS
jgi:ferrous iron transport protein A